MKKIALLVSLAIPVLALAVSAEDAGKKALSQLGGEQSLSQLAPAPVPLPVVVDIPSARPWPSYPPPHARMECRAYDKGWEEHWGGHGGGPNEIDACRACFAKHGDCRYDCTVDMYRCEARFNPYNTQPQPPQPGYNPYPNPGQPGYNPYPPGYNPYPPGYNPYPPANPYPNPGYHPYPPPPPPGHWTPKPPSHPYHKAGPGLYSGELRPDRYSAEDSAIRNCTQANYGVPGYCTISTCTPQKQSVKSGRCRR